MRRAKLVLFGNDQGANNVLDSVQRAAETHRDLDVIRIPGLNAPLTPASKQQMLEADALVFGISTLGDDAEGFEMGLAHDLLQRNPNLSGCLVFVEDFPGSSGVRSFVSGKVGPHARLCSIMQLPADAPERKLYRSVHAVGLPHHWSDSMTNVLEGSRFRQSGALRKRRHGSEESVALSGEVIIYFSGFKDPPREMRVLQTLRAIGEIDGRPLLVHFRPHPGEKSRADLQSGIAEREALLADHWELASPEIVDAEQFADARLIGAADVPIMHPGATAIFHVAALRKPAVCPMEILSDEFRRTSSFDYGMAARYACVVESLGDLPTAIASLLRDDSPERAALRATQQANALPFDPNVPSMYGQNVMGVVRDIVGRQ